jgi:hypothetical protein
MRDNNRPKIKAQRNPSILIPGTNLSANTIMITFIIKRKSPNVIIVSGSVNKTRRGLTIAFSTASTNAKIIAVVKEFIVTCSFKSIDNT